MKNNVIKILVVIIAALAYFNVSQYFEVKTLNEQNALLQQSITDLENLQVEDDETCNKLNEITIQVISSSDDVDQSFIHCTNKVYLGDALDEIVDDLQVVYNPNFDKDYVYGRLVHSFYGLDKEFEEYYEITINGTRATVGVDFVEIEDGYSYEFTLVRWA